MSSMRRLTLGFVSAILLAAQETQEKRQKARELLDVAAEMVTSAQPSVQVAALLHLGDNYQYLDRAKAQEFLERAFQGAADLPTREMDDQRGQMRSEILGRMAEVSLDKAIEMLPSLAPPAIPENPLFLMFPVQGPIDKIVKLLVERGEFDRAVRVLEDRAAAGAYPFTAARALFEKLPADDPRRVQVFAGATAAYVGRPVGSFHDFLSRLWEGVPRPMVESALQVLLSTILDRKQDSVVTTNLFTSKGAVSFSSQQDVELFEILHVVRALDPKRAAELVESRPELRSALDRFPRGSASLEAEPGAGVHGSMGFRPQRDSASDAEQRVRSIAASRKAEAVAAAKSDPEKALALVRAIPLAPPRAEALAAIARSVGDKDAVTARSVLDQCVRILDEIKNPMDRMAVWEIVAEAAHKAGEDQRAWQALDRGMADAAAIYKIETDAENPNQAMRENWVSTDGCRRMAWQAATLFGVEAEVLLVKITDPDVALLARIEMAQALLGKPRSDVDVHSPPTARP